VLLFQLEPQVHWN
jgi:hypothetical protein